MHALTALLALLTLAHSTPLTAKRQSGCAKSNYSGVSKKTVPDGTAWNYAVAQVVVPDTTYVDAEDPSHGTRQTAAAWVGFGGTGGGPGEGIIQTGCSFYNDGQGDLYTRCWYEFYPDAPVFYDLAPTAGATMQMEIWRLDAKTGRSLITNLDSGRSATADFTCSNGDVANPGRSADWVVENPQARPNLVNFGEIAFQGASAQTAGGNTYGPGDGGYTLYNEFKDLGDGAGCTQWTSTSVPSSSEVVVDFVANYS